MSSNGKRFTVDGRDRQAPAPPLNLKALSEDLQVVAAKMLRTHSQVEALDLEIENAGRLAAHDAELDLARTQIKELGARIDLFREQVTRWVSDEQTATQTLRQLATLLDID